jgi:hypothetical protein
MIVFKIILCLFMVVLAYEVYWLATHRDAVKRFVDENQLTPRPVVRNNVLIEAAVVATTLLTLVLFVLLS